MYSTVGGESFMRRKISLVMRCIIPDFSSLLGVSLFGFLLDADSADDDFEEDEVAAASEAPIMVCDLPVPVCP